MAAWHHGCLHLGCRRQPIFLSFLITQPCVLGCSCNIAHSPSISTSSRSHKRWMAAKLCAYKHPPRMPAAFVRQKIFLAGPAAASTVTQQACLFTLTSPDPVSLLDAKPLTRETCADQPPQTGSSAPSPREAAEVGSCSTVEAAAAVHRLAKQPQAMQRSRQCLQVLMPVQFGCPQIQEGARRPHVPACTS